MPRLHPDNVLAIRQEIASRAARLIAEDGLDYATAKRKAVRELGGSRIQGDFMPDNEEIADEVRLYQQLFQADTQPERLASLRRTAAALMRLLAEYRPYVTGAVLNGTAGKHSDIHLHLYADSAKDVEIFLLNQGIDYEAGEMPAEGGRGPVETVSFMWSPDPRARVAPEGVHLVLNESRALRNAPTERADLAALEALIAANDPADAKGEA